MAAFIAGRHAASGLITLLAALSAAQPARAATAEEELIALEDQRREAIRIKDHASLGRIYAPEFMAVAGNGQLIDRTALFRLFDQGGSALKFETDEIRIQLHGDTAVFFGRLTGRTPTGELATVSRFSHVFIRREGRWMCVAGQSTPIAAP
ncbi:nuclear transport factor 2 family protein [Ideonella sp. YS5]|uniref:nuclear transport factor 2 family protein n=1 Tax=Ideonella sp. YS5 TaxID=3453714 RepID=UPI003EE93BB6